MKVIIFLLFSAFIYSQSNYSTYSKSSHKIVYVPKTNGFDKLISDYDFTNQNYKFLDVYRFVKKFPRNRWTNNEIYKIYLACKENIIHPLIIITKLEVENNLLTCASITNDSTYYYRMTWALGCSMYDSIDFEGVKIKPYAGFETQIWRAAWKLHTWQTNYKKGVFILLNLNTVKVYPQNGATYALYLYTPFYGQTIENGALCSGNEYFSYMLEKYKKIWSETNGKY